MLALVSTSRRPARRELSRSSSVPTRRRTQAASDARYCCKDLSKSSNLNNLTNSLTNLNNLNNLDNFDRLLRLLKSLGQGLGLPLALVLGNNLACLQRALSLLIIIDYGITHVTLSINYMPSASCLTNDGPAAGSACAFPFNFMGVSHFGCTTIDGDTRPWCSTQTDANDDHVTGVGAWGYCDASCPVQGIVVPLVVEQKSSEVLKMR